MHDFKWLSKSKLDGLPVDTLLETSDGILWKRGVGNIWNSLDNEDKRAKKTLDLILKHPIGRLIDPKITS